MNDFLDIILGGFKDRKEWRSIKRRAKLLPDDYQFAYEEIKKYIWNSPGVSTIDVFRILLDIFEESSANGKDVLEIIGNDVASFSDELVKDEKSYSDYCRKKLNINIAKKLKK